MSSYLCGGRCRVRRIQRSPAIATELKGTVVFFAALGAAHRQTRAAFTTELSAEGIFRPALGAVHRVPGPSFNYPRMLHQTPGLEEPSSGSLAPVPPFSPLAEPAEIP